MRGTTILSAFAFSTVALVEEAGATAAGESAVGAGPRRPRFASSTSSSRS
jgi:hypothetical protein